MHISSSNHEYRQRLVKLNDVRRPNNYVPTYWTAGECLFKGNASLLKVNDHDQETD